MPVSRLRIAAVLICLPLFAAACGGDGDSTPTSPSTSSAPYSQTDLVVGTGAEATAGRLVTVSYTGWLYDTSRTDSKGTQFDSGTTQATQIGVGRFITGFDRGVVGMRVGGRRRVIIPPDLGYGAAGRAPSIPGNATLLFEMELLSVQ